MSEEDQAALPAAAGLEGVDAEIAVLRLCIRRAAGAGDIETSRRGIESLWRALETKHQLEAQGLGITLEAAPGTLDRGSDASATAPAVGLARPGAQSQDVRGAFQASAPAPAAGHAHPAQEIEAAALVLRYQAGDPEALELLHGLLEVAILAVLLHYCALQPPSTTTLEELQDQSRMVLAELAERWRPGVSFLGYVFRSFPSAIARYVRRAGGAGRPVPAHPPPRRIPHRAASAQSVAPSPWEGPFGAADLASLPELERQILLLRASEGQHMEGIARQVGVPVGTAYKLYQRARGRLKGQARSPEDHSSIAMRRLVQALHVAAGPGGRLPNRAWAMAAAGLKRLEYDQLIARLEGAGAIYGRHRRVPGHLGERDAAATLARVGDNGEAHRRDMLRARGQ